MILNFQQALRTLTRTALWRLANVARPESEYLFREILPDTLRPTFDVQQANMTVRTTMAGLVGTDSVYPPGGIVQADSFREGTAKIATSVPLGEQTIRELHQLLMAQAAQATINGTPMGSKVDLAEEALNFVDKVVIQAIRDTMEYLRGQALVHGSIDWTFNRKRLQVDYGVPSENMLATRTSTAAYGGSASGFWADVRTAQRLLRYNVQTFLAHSETMDVVLSNPANALAVVGQDMGSFTIRRQVPVNSAGAGALTQFSTDARDLIRVVVYNQEGEILDPTTAGATIRLPFLSRGKILAIGAPGASGYQVGQGSTVPADANIALGYTHVGPTIEGDGAMGIWAEAYTPDEQPWSLVGRGAANVLPVITQPKKLVVLSTDMPS